MNFQLNCFYKNTLNNLVYRCVQIDPVVLEDDKKLQTIPLKEEVWYKSGMNPKNWETRNDAARKHNQDESVVVDISRNTYNKLRYLGILSNDVRSSNVGQSNYSKHFIQPWSIWLDYPELTSWDHDIIKRVLRTKEGTPRSEDYEKIIHICKERLRQLQYERN